jgi:ATP phosphoribosyltransferase
MLDRAGFDTTGPRGDSRSLIFELDGLTIVTVRPSDVPIYVESGAADLGVTGKDVLTEQTDRDVYELVDLGFGRCRMALAARSGRDDLERAERRLGWFERMGRQAEVIEVKGSVELAPLVGLADGIVDLVDTGRTLAENGLEVVDEISVCTARLIANRVAHKLRATEIDAMVDRLREAAAE